MAEQFKDPWADAANQAVGALYKYYLTRPTQADLAAAQMERDTKAAQLQRIQIQNRTDQGALDLGSFASPNLSPEIRNDLYRRSIETREGAGSDAAKLFGTYVNKPVQVDAGDTKYIADGSTGAPIYRYGMGVAPERTIDKEGGRQIISPAIPATYGPVGGPVVGDTGRQIVTAMADQAGVNPALADGVFGAESSFGHNQGPSSAGATGPMQVMPDTARNPGFGVRPMQNDSQHENARMGVDYLAAMVNRYKGDEKLALMAYNWGPGNVDNWLQSGADPNAVPAETVNYVQKVLSTDVSGQMGAPAAPQQPQAPASQVPNLFAPQTMPDGTVVMELPKSPIAQAKEDERNRTQGIVSDVMNDDINGIFKLNDNAMLPTTGMVGSALSNVGGTASNDIRVKLTNIKAGIARDTLQEMRQNSPTGGALGNVSDKDIDLLQSRYGAVEQSQSQEQFLYHLARLQNAYNDVIHGVNGGPPRLDPDIAAMGYTNEDIDYTVQQNGVSRDDVIARLKGGR